MRARAFALAAIVVTAAAGLAACGERQSTPIQKTGRYQGKPDTRPWDSPEWGGDRARWERGIEARTINQNEYARER
jgi:hypothetical protein